MAKTVVLPTDVGDVFTSGLAQIRIQNGIPASFPVEVLAAAEEAARRPLGSEHVDRTELAFVTLDPTSSTDLDQAFAIERAAGGDMLLRYAIADVAWFVRAGDALDTEAWRRGVTIYLPDGRAGLYPPGLSEAAASLLAERPRPAVVYIVRVTADGDAHLDGVERAIIRSRAKLGYETATATDLPDGFDEFAARLTAAEERRGASRVETPEQEVVPDGEGRYHLALRPRLANEDSNAAMSLATNLAVAGALLAARTGLFRVMADPDERSINRLRFTARALALEWPANVDLRAFQRSLEPNNTKHAAFLIAVRRATGGADYAAYADGVTPWHSAMAATYCHTTAPLRRLADRYVIEAALAIANGASVPETVQQAFTRLPKEMDAAETRASTVERAVIDLAEAVVLHGAEGRTFTAVVTDIDDRGARIQLCDPAVVARVPARHVEPGDEVRVRLVAADPVKRQITFERVS